MTFMRKVESYFKIILLVTKHIIIFQQMYFLSQKRVIYFLTNIHLYYSNN